MSSPVIAARQDFPMIELSPLAVRAGETVEEMVAGLPNNNPEITSAHFPACESARPAGGESGLFLAKPMHDRQHLPTDEVLRLLDAAGLVPAGLPELAALKKHADELWAAGVYYIIALSRDCIWQQADGGYAPYLILNPLDRGFHLHWLGADTAGGTKAVADDQRADLPGQLWFLVRRKGTR